MSKRAWIIVGAVVALIVLIGGVVAATSGGDDEPEVATDTTTTTTTLVPTGGNTGGGGTPSGQSSGGGATGPQPTVVNFTTLSGNADVDCHNGNSQNFSATWDTTDAVRVAISGGGDNLAPDGETSLPFECLSAPHTYTLTAYGSGGKTATRSLTLPARNVQQPDPGDEEDL